VSEDGCVDIRIEIRIDMTKPMQTLRQLWPHVGQCLVLVSGCFASAVFAQLEALQPTAANAQQLMNTSSSLDAGKDNKAFSPTKIFAKPNASGVAYDLKERPAGKPTPTVLNTVVETKVENKTTNQISQEPNGSQQTPPDTGVKANQAPLPYFNYDFASLVRSSVGSSLPIFGSTYLAGDAQKLGALDPLTIPADYRIGAGDDLLIRAWGQIDIDFQGQVDRSGTIFLSKIGTIMVAGRKLSDLPLFFKTVIGRQYKNFEVTVSLGSMRQIQYYVSGFARQVGTHSTESIATALHGLLAAGGALPEGDLRRIELRRAGQPTVYIDAYQLLAEGQKSQDPQLQPGDILHIPAAKGFFAVAGNVRRPSIYHLAEGMTLSDAMRLAGGVALGQDGATIRLERLKNVAAAAGASSTGQTRQLDVFDASSANMNNPLRDGDLLMVLPVSPRFDTAVTLRGNVAQPLRQAHRVGMRVSDLLNPATAFIRPSVWMERNGRSGMDTLNRGSRELDFAVDFPDINWEYAAIERFDHARQSMQLVPFNLRQALQKDSNHNIELLPGDTVVIFAKQDFRQPESEFLRVVKVEGEVRSPGLYPIKPGETLKDMINRAGGLTERAYVFGTIFSRQSARKTEMQMLKEAADRIEQDYLRYLAGRARNATSQEDASIGAPELESIRALVNKLRTADPEGRVALDLKGATAEFLNYPLLALEDQDRIIVPPRPATVTVMGAVFRQGTLLWSEGANVSSYVKNSGGLRQYADSDGFMIFRADGTVRQVTRSWMSSGRETLNPGDTIIVPEDVQSQGWTRLFRDWSQIFYQLGLGTAALKILRTSL
jgi:polysaccharide biosynthesis/export protein